MWLPFRILHVVSEPDLQNEARSKRFGEVYSSLRIWSSELVKFYYSFFCFHRLVFVFSLFVLEGRPLLQLALNALASLLLCFYLILTRPFARSLDHLLSVINGIFLVIVFLYCFVFVVFHELEMRAVLGLGLMVGIFSMNGINFLILLFTKIYECHKKCKHSRRKKAKAKHRPNIKS